MKKVKAILVHGTFARNALWDDCAEEGKEDSVFVRQLRDGLKARGVELTVEPFHWSGENSHQARRAAALQLNDRINAIEDKGAFDGGLFVIGHSHGGTVARLAVNLDPNDVDPDGVVTFGSPFVRFQPRPVKQLMTALMWVLGFAIAAAVMAAGVVALITPGDGAVFWVAGAVALAGIVGGYWLIRSVRRFRDRLIEIQTELRRDYDPPGSATTQYLNYHARFDEAGVLLRFWSLPTWIFHTLISTLVNTSFLIVLIGTGAIIYGVLALFREQIPVVGDVITLVDAWVFGPTLEAISGALELEEEEPLTAEALAQALPIGVTLAGIVTIAVLLGASLVMAPFAVFLPWFLRKQNIAFGGEAPTWSIASDINVDRMAHPKAEMRTTFLPGAWARGQWQHNYYYQDPRLVSELADRMAAWTTKASRPWNIEGWALATVRFLFQAFIVVMFLIVALALTAVTAESNL